MKGFDQYKTCTGPAHAGPTRLPLTAEHWNFHRSGAQAGQAVSRCNLCNNWTKLVEKYGPHGYVEVNDALRDYAKELGLRCGGYWPLRSAHELRPETIRAIAEGTKLRVQKKTVVRILVALGEQRKTDRRNGASPSFVQAKREQAEREDRIGRFAGY